MRPSAHLGAAGTFSMNVYARVMHSVAPVAVAVAVFAGFLSAASTLSLLGVCCLVIQVKAKMAEEAERDRELYARRAALAEEGQELAREDRKQLQVRRTCRHA